MSVIFNFTRAVYALVCDWSELTANSSLVRNCRLGFWYSLHLILFIYSASFCVKSTGLQWYTYCTGWSSKTAFIGYRKP